MARALKVFRTLIGFHDACVAAPSRKAALARAKRRRALEQGQAATKALLENTLDPARVAYDRAIRDWRG